MQIINLTGRSRKGAWIEINVWSNVEVGILSRSRKGAWIEIEEEKEEAEREAKSLP